MDLMDFFFLSAVTYGIVSKGIFEHASNVGKYLTQICVVIRIISF